MTSHELRLLPSKFVSIPCGAQVVETGGQQGSTFNRARQMESNSSSPAKGKWTTQRLVLCGILASVALIFYGCYPEWRRRSIEREIVSKCHMKTTFIRKLTTLPDLGVMMTDANTEQEVCELSRICLENSRYIQTVSIVAKGRKWRIDSFASLAPLCQKHSIAVTVLILESDSYPKDGPQIQWCKECE